MRELGSGVTGVYLGEQLPAIIFLPLSKQVVTKLVSSLAKVMDHKGLVPLDRQIQILSLLREPLIKPCAH